MKLSDEDIDRISLMRDDGKTTKEIAAEFGVAESTMRSRIFTLTKAGKIGYIRRQKYWTDEDLNELIRLKTDAHTVEEMTTRFGVSPLALIRKVEKLVKSGRLPDSEISWKKNQLTEYLDAYNLCHGCMSREKFHRKQYCPECLERILNYSLKQHSEPKEKKRARYYQHKENGICIRCNRPATYGVYCYRHYIEMQKICAERARKRAFSDKPTVWDIRKANHLCRVCGAPIEESNTTQWCNACRERSSRIAAATNARMRAEGRDFKFGRALYEQRADRSHGQGS